MPELRVLCLPCFCTVSSKQMNCSQASEKFTSLFQGMEHSLKDVWVCTGQLNGYPTTGLRDVRECVVEINTVTIPGQSSLQ